MINEQYARAKQILEEHKEGHNKLAELLISREVIFAEDVENIFGKRPWVSRSQEIMEANEEREMGSEEPNANSQTPTTDSEPTLEDMPEVVRQAQADFEKNKEKE